MPVRTGTSSMMLWSELSKIIIVVVFLVKLIDSDFADIRTEEVDSVVMDVIKEENESYRVKRESHRNEVDLPQKEESARRKEREMYQKERQSRKGGVHHSRKDKISKPSGRDLKSKFNKKEAKKQAKGLPRIKKRKSKRHFGTMTPGGILVG